MENRQFITFYLGEDLFGLDILLVREINRHLELTRVDRTPEFVRGLMNLRGQIVTVLDLGIRLGIGARAIERESSCIVLKTRGELERYPPLRASRVQLNPRPGSDEPVRWRQCRTM